MWQLHKRVRAQVHGSTQGVQHAHMNRSSPVSDLVGLKVLLPERDANERTALGIEHTIGDEHTNTIGDKAIGDETHEHHWG